MKKTIQLFFMLHVAFVSLSIEARPLRRETAINARQRIARYYGVVVIPTRPNTPVDQILQGAPVNPPLLRRPAMVPIRANNVEAVRPLIFNIAQANPARGILVLRRILFDFDNDQQ